MNTSMGVSHEVYGLSLKELIEKINDWYSYLKKKWLIILFTGTLSAGVLLMYAWLQKPTYVATLTFALEEERSSSGGLSSALGLATSLGFDLGGGGNGAFSGGNLIELMKSRNVVTKALLYPITINDSLQSLMDYYLRSSGIITKNQSGTSFKEISFRSNTDPSMFNRRQDSILNIVYNNIVDQGGGLLTVGQKDKKIGILTVEVKSKDEFFAKSFAEILVKVVSDFYIETKSKKARDNYEILKKQTDSIRSELNNALSGVAYANDNTYNLNPALNSKRIPSAKKQIDVQANTAILTQLTANLELSKVSLRKETPLIQIIDTPRFPLMKTKLGKAKAVVIGFFLGFFISVFGIVLLRIWERLIADYEAN